MNDVTQILSAIQQGDPRAAELLLPLVYDELRRLAAQKLAQEKPGHTLQATALVHEAYLRLVGNDIREKTDAREGEWENRGHFFAAAAEAMRRILVEQARHKHRQKHGGNCRRVDFEQALSIADTPVDDVLALDEALTRLESVDPLAANVVKLRYFAGLTMPETAEHLGIPLRTVERNWTYARTWLRRDLSESDSAPPDANL